MGWSEDKDLITGSYFEATNANNIELFRIINENYDQLRDLLPLIEFIIERLNAVNTLVINDQVWDAEIIGRSALETLVKFVFIADAADSERPQLLKEFWYDLSEIYNLKLSEQAKKNFKHTSESEIHKLAYSPLVMSPEEESRLRTKWSKSLRTQLEQKWSFSGIVNYISQKYKGNPMESFEFVTHTYRIASHVTHGDEMGINLIRERKSRNDTEREAVHMAHYLRLLSDCYYYCNLTSIYTMKCLKLSPTYFINLSKSLKEIQILVSKYHNIPFEDKLYDKFR